MRISMKDLNHRLLAPIEWVRGGSYDVTKAYRLSWAIVLVHHLAVVAAGLVGFLGPPPPSIANITGGEIASYIWSSMFILFGVTGLIARLARKARAEVVAVVCVATARTLWAVILFVSVNMGINDPGSMQIAILMLSGAIFLVGWSMTTLVWLSGAPLSPPGQGQLVALEELRDVVQSVVDEQVAQDGE